MVDPATGLEIVAERTLRVEDMDPCGECLKGECDLCEGCRWVMAEEDEA